MKAAALFFCFLIIICYHIFGFVGHFGYDDMSYARIAHDLTQGQFNAGDNYSYRWLLTGLTALSYKIFGITELASALPAMIATFSMLLFVFLILQREKIFILAIALLLLTLNHWSIYYADKLMPDVFLATSLTAALYFFSKYKYHRPAGKVFPLAVAFSASVFAAFLSKETLVLILPAFLWLMITDIILKRDLRFWLVSVLSGILLTGSYLLLLHFTFGNAFVHFHAIASNAYINSCSYDVLGTAAVLERISTGFSSMLVSQGMAASLAVALSGIFMPGFRKLLLFKDKKSFFALFSILLLLSSNFMTVSVFSYNPMCTDPRHFLFLIPPASVASAYIIGGTALGFFRFIPAISCAAVALVSLSLPGGTFGDLYFPLCILLLTLSFIKTASRLKIIVFLSILTGILAIKPFRMVDYAQAIQYNKQRALTEKLIISNQQDIFVITDEVQKRLGDYYTGFDPDAKTKFITFNEYQYSSLANTGDVVLLLNGYTMKLSATTQADIPSDLRHLPSGSIIYRDPEIPFEIFRIQK